MTIWKTASMTVMQATIVCMDGFIMSKLPAFPAWIEGKEKKIKKRGNDTQLISDRLRVGSSPRGSNAGGKGQ